MSSLVAFKRLHDDNVPLEDAMPEFVAKRPARYRGKRLKDLCGEMHAFFRESRREPTADGAIRRQAFAGAGHDAARSLAPTGAQ